MKLLAYRRRTDDQVGLNSDTNCTRLKERIMLIHSQHNKYMKLLPYRCSTAAQVGLNSDTNCTRLKERIMLIHSQHNKYMTERHLMFPTADQV